MALSKTTRDHEEIRRWAESHGAVPSEVASTQRGKEPGILRFQFPDAAQRNDDNLQEISWDDFFEKFDANGLELIYQEQTADGEKSNFNKLVYPENDKSQGSTTRPSRSTTQRASTSRSGSRRSSNGTRSAGRTASKSSAKSTGRSAKSASGSSTKRSAKSSANGSARSTAKSAKKAAKSTGRRSSAKSA